MKHTAKQGHTSCATAGSAAATHTAQHVTSVALALPAYLPAGSEAAAVRALSTAFQAALMGPVLTSACQALQRLEATVTPLTLAAAGFSFQQMQTMQGGQDSSNARSSHADGPPATCCDIQQSQEQSQASHIAEQPDDGDSGQNAGTHGNPQPAQQHVDDQDKHKLSDSAKADALSESQPGGSRTQQAGTDNKVLYPLGLLPEPARWCEALLHGYSSAWLGLVPVASNPHQYHQIPIPTHHTPSTLSLLEPAGDLVVTLLRQYSRTATVNFYNECWV